MAQTAPPTPIQGFSGRATFTAQAQVTGAQVRFSAELAVMASRRRVRLDVIHLEFFGGDSTAGALIAQFLPRGAVTFVYDQRARVATFWSDQKRVYYQTKTRALPMATSTPSPQPIAAPSSPLDQFLRGAKSMTEYDVFNQSLTLVGHEPVNGHTASVFHLMMHGQKHGGAAQDLIGDVALADDLSGIPVRLWFTGTGEHAGMVKLDLTSASLGTPDESVFAVPRGYRKVDDVLQVLAPSPSG
ncbi:MAG: hypothetical protein DLM50_03975 [Candidatus Meridianibacter frigidus]|nr:MAG: hypothetical protein DLM50_03975 [Candidatus Eremiobacteraeota bacterium]